MKNRREMKKTEITEIKRGGAEVKQEKAFAKINLRSFLLVLIILGATIVATGILSYVIPGGHFERDKHGAIIPGTYVQGAVRGLTIFEIISAPISVFFSSDGLTITMICVFLLVMSGVFNVMEKTDGVKVIIKSTVRRFAGKKNLLIAVATLVFMAFGSFFGMFEELVTLLPLVVVLMISLGFDTLTGAGVCMLAACFGFSAAILNPFSVGLASNIAHVSVLDGVWLRIVFFVLIYALVLGFLFLHIRRIRKKPENSLTYELDLNKRREMSEDGGPVENEKKIFKTYAIFFGVQLLILIVIASVRAIADFSVPILSVSFLTGGLIAGYAVKRDGKFVLKNFFKGAASMLPAILAIALASSVKYLMTKSNVLDTIMNALIGALNGKSIFECVLLIYLLTLVLQVFIGSASAKLVLIMPIILPVCAAVGISPQLVILTYCIADGFTDMLLPTNPVLIIGLSMIGVSYGKWIKWTWLLQLTVFALTVLLLLFAVSIGY